MAPQNGLRVYVVCVIIASGHMVFRNQDIIKILQQQEDHQDILPLSSSYLIPTKEQYSLLLVIFI